MLYNPKVSIIIPVYNGTNYLKKAIDSALAQTYSNYEIIVINDGSTDNGATRDLAVAYGNKIRYFEKQNGGVATALNLGIKEMHGEYFSWLSHDDEYYANKLQRQIEFIAKNKNPDELIFTDFSIVDEKSKVLDVVKCYNQNLNHFDPIAFGLLSGCTMLIPRRCFEVVGYFDPGLPTTQDYDMWFRLLTKYQIRHLPEVLVRSRHHGQQQSRTECLYHDECNNFYINFIQYLQKQTSENSAIDELYFIKMAAFFKKTQYYYALDYLNVNQIEKNWINELKFLYYLYINTNWGNSIGLFSIASDPRRLINKVFSKSRSYFSSYLK